MRMIDFKLPNGEVISLVVFAKGFHPVLNYLQSSRSGQLRADSSAPQMYQSMEATYASQLAAVVLQQFPDVEAIVSPPSSKNFASVYRAKILQGKSIPDLSGGFKRFGAVRAATAPSHVDVFNAYSFQPTQPLGGIKSLLVVDDVVGQGFSIWAVVEHLRRNGLPSDCKIVAAAALLVQ